jgi:HD-GYP domain-containing protein (c-di-GMP phosphodiesterase class II)
MAPIPIVSIVLQHHERVDGSGYPAGLAGDQISLEARIIHTTDAYMAMTENVVEGMTLPFAHAHTIPRTLPCGRSGR